MKTVKYLCAIAISGLSAHPALSKTMATCPFIKSIYVSKGPKSYILTFATLRANSGIMNDFALRIQSSNKSVTRWYYFDGGSAREVPLISTLDPTKAGWKFAPDEKKPYGNVTYIGLDHDGTIADIAPRANDKAPAFIIIPELPQVLRKSSPVFNTSAFKLIKCS